MLKRLRSLLSTAGTCIEYFPIALLLSTLVNNVHMSLFRAKLTVSKDFKFGETNKSADFLKKFPLGKVEINEIC